MQVISSCSTQSKSLEKSNNELYPFSKDQKERIIYTVVEDMPTYQGGESSFLKFILENFKYPNQESLQTKFIVEFVIDCDGTVLLPKIKDKNDTELTGAEKELLKVISMMPKWNPGKHNNQNVPVKMTIPINIEIDHW